MNNLTLAYTIQGLSSAVAATLLWGGALVCIEDRLPGLDPNPSRLGLLVGSLLIAFGLWRSALVFHLDAAIYGLAILQGLGLALLLVPPRKLLELYAPLLVLAMMGLGVVLPQFVPIAELSLVTARVTQGLLALIGQTARVMGPEVWLPGGGIRIAGSCSGSETVAQLAMIATIFVLAFPLPNRRVRLLMLALAPLLGVLGNAFRIAFLAVINASDWRFKKDWFDFFHESNGALIFSALTVSVFAWIYLKLLDRQLGLAKDSNA